MSGAAEIRKPNDTRSFCFNCRAYGYGYSYEVLEQESAYYDTYFICHGCKEDWIKTMSLKVCSECKVLIRGLTSGRRCKICIGDISVVGSVDALERKEKTFFTPKGSFDKNHKTIKDNVFMGVELELECTLYADNFTIKDFRKCFSNRADACCDGSLDDGIEIRTDPMTYEEIYNSKVWDRFDKLSKKTKAFESKPPTAGMHVHVSENAMTRENANKIASFLHKHSIWALIISERDSLDNEYVQYSPTVPTNNHYGAINYTRHKTYEFRIFQGKPCKQNIYKNLDFIKAIIDYSKVCGKEIVPQKFVNFVNNRPEKYKNLRKYLHVQGFKVDMHKKSKRKSVVIIDSIPARKAAKTVVSA